MKEKQLLTNTEWEVCECLWEDSPLTMTQIAARLTERTSWTKSTGETLVKVVSSLRNVSDFFVKNQLSKDVHMYVRFVVVVVLV